jgi:hypothetical protein
LGVVRSEMPKIDLTDEDRTRYRVGRKVRAVRRKRVGLGIRDNLTTMRGLRR